MSIDEVLLANINDYNVLNPMALTLVSTAGTGVTVTQPGGAGSDYIRFEYVGISPTPDTDLPWHTIKVTFTVTTTGDSIWNYRLRGNDGGLADLALFLMNVSLR